MKTRPLYTLSFFLILSFNLQAQYTLTLSDVTFEDGKITDYLNTTEKDIIIPDNFEGEAVTMIGPWAFGHDDLVAVTFPNSLTHIEKWAFYGNKLDSIVIPNTITTITGESFADNKLTSVTIPNSVTTISYFAFRYNNLKSIDIPNTVTSIGYYAFGNNHLQSITIPNSITSIADYAFADNNLTTLIIPDNITTIKEFAFRNNNLDTVIIPNSVTTIEDYVFRDNNLSCINLPSSLTSIGKGVFLYNPLTTFNLPSHHEGFSYSWNDRTNNYKSGDLVTDLFNAYNLSEKGFPVHYITYHLDGGSSKNRSAYTSENESIILSDATKTGHDFQGWFTDKNFTNSITEIPSGSIEDFELFAQFTETIIYYTISYQLDEGLTTNPDSYSKADEITLYPATKEGYEFNGWFMEGEFINEITEISIGTEKDLELFAKYTEIELSNQPDNKNITLHFYPNPSTDYITSEVDIINLQLINTQGSVVKNFTETFTSFNITNLPQGHYILRARDKNGILYHSSIVKK